MYAGDSVGRIDHSDDIADPDAVEVVASLEAVRQRPHMYVGSARADVTDLVFEVMCLAIAEAACGSCRTINVRTDDLVISVVDDGLGLSMEVDQSGLPFAQRAMTMLGVCRDHKEHERLKHEICGVGLAVVNAFSRSASVTTFHDGQRVQQTYTDGIAEGPFVATGASGPTGTTLEFVLNPAFVGERELNAATLRSMVGALSVDLTDLTLSIECAQP